MRDPYLNIVLALVAITAVYFVLQVLGKHLQYRLIARARAAGWTHITIDSDGSAWGRLPGPTYRTRYITNAILKEYNV